jgi:hypothetical protein
MIRGTLLATLLLAASACGDAPTAPPARPEPASLNVEPPPPPPPPPADTTGDGGGTLGSGT